MARGEAGVRDASGAGGSPDADLAARSRRSAPESAAIPVGYDAVERRDRLGHLVLRVVEGGRAAHDARPIVDDDAAIGEAVDDRLRIADLDRDDTAATRGVADGSDAEARRLGTLDEQLPQGGRPVSQRRDADLTYHLEAPARERRA